MGHALHMSGDDEKCYLRRKSIFFLLGGSMREVWWLNGIASDCCPTVPGLIAVSPQPTADCPSPGGLPPGMAFGRGLTSVRGNRGENYENEPMVRQKHAKKKKCSAFNEQREK
jgi:hypothetical protein